jgi:hypothetical protein
VKRKAELQAKGFLYFKERNSVVSFSGRRRGSFLLLRRLADRCGSLLMIFLVLGPAAAGFVVDVDGGMIVHLSF